MSLALSRGRASSICTTSRRAGARGNCGYITAGRGVPAQPANRMATDTVQKLVRRSLPDISALQVCGPPGACALDDDEEEARGPQYPIVRMQAVQGREVARYT